MRPTELVRRFKNHKLDEHRAKKCEQLRLSAHNLADMVNGLCPEGREKSIAITKIEEAVMWANKAISMSTNDA